MESLAPEGGLQAGVRAPSTRSLALAEYVTTTPAGPGASTEKFEGTVTVGGVLSSLTVTDCVPLDRPSWFVASHVRVVPVVSLVSGWSTHPVSIHVDSG